MSKGFRKSIQPTKGAVMQENASLQEELGQLKQHVQFLNSVMQQVIPAVSKLTPEVNAMGSVLLSSEVARGAELNDHVIIDYLGKLLNEDGTEGADFDGGYGEGFAILGLGGGSLVPGFETQIVGRKAGESFAIDVTFPEKYPTQDLANKKARFHIYVHKIMAPMAVSFVREMKRAIDIAKYKEKQTNEAVQSAGPQA